MFQVGEIVDNKYKIVRKIGAGSFGTVYIAFDYKNNRNIALKTENVKTPFPLTIYEANVACILNGYDKKYDPIQKIECSIEKKVQGLTKVHGYGCYNNTYYMSMELMGPSLSDLFNFCGRQFSLKTSVMIAFQIIQTIQHIHEMNFIHRDIKPDNFVVGMNSKSKIVHMIDLGLAKKFIKTKTGKHIPQKFGKSLTGTARYASIHAHNGEELSRRDDLEAIGYMLIFFMKGGLPWQNVEDNVKEQKYIKILDMKVQTPIEKLCEGLPFEMTQYLTYCRGLSFEQKPNYKYILGLFKNIASKYELNINDNRYDWCTKAVLIKKYQNFYNYLCKKQIVKIFDNKGNLVIPSGTKILETQNLIEQSKHIYIEAKQFQFTDWKQFKNLQKLDLGREFLNKQPKIFVNVNSESSQKELKEPSPKFENEFQRERYLMKNKIKDFLKVKKLNKIKNENHVIGNDQIIVQADAIKSVNQNENMDVEEIEYNLSDTDEFADLSYTEHEKKLESKLQIQFQQIPSMSAINKVAKNGMRTLYPNRRKKLQTLSNQSPDLNQLSSIIQKKVDPRIKFITSKKQSNNKLQQAMSHSQSLQPINNSIQENNEQIMKNQNEMNVSLSNFIQIKDINIQLEQNEQIEESKHQVISQAKGLNKNINSYSLQIQSKYLQKFMRKQGSLHESSSSNNEDCSSGPYYELSEKSNNIGDIFKRDVMNIQHQNQNVDGSQQSKQIMQIIRQSQNISKQIIPEQEDEIDLQSDKIKKHKFSTFKKEYESLIKN